MVSCNYVACRRTHIFKAYVNQLPPMHHPSQAHGYDSVIDGRTTIELPRKLVTYHVNPPLSLSLPFPLCCLLCLMKFTRVSSFMLDVGFTLQGSILKSIRSQVFPERLYVFWEWKFIEPLEKWKPKTVFLGQEIDVFWHETEAFL